MKDPFDDWLEQRLSEGSRRLGSRPVRPFSTRRLPRFGLAVPAALGAKAVAGLAVAALAAGGGVAIARTVDPGAFGQSVKSTVQSCRQQPPGKRGECVSDYVTSHNPGASHRSTHANPGAHDDGANPKPGAGRGPAAVAASPTPRPDGKPTKTGGRP
jgi:hypothetical protein